MERQIANEIREFAEELDFALRMVKYAQDISSYSKHICFSKICDIEERSLYAQKMIHPFLAEQTNVVSNDISIGNGREFILLGGVNRGGKTTYLRTMGVVQLLFQMGLPIPAASAAISPASGIFSIFSRVEDTELYQGKLGRELTELRDIIAMLDNNSLFLGNEPVSGTSPTESYLLSREALCMLKAKRVRGIWVTHLFGLFDDVEKLNNLNFGIRFECMHTEYTDGERSYVISLGKPKKYSGAKEVFLRCN